LHVVEEKLEKRCQSFEVDEGRRSLLFLEILIHVLVFKTYDVVQNFQFQIKRKSLVNQPSELVLESDLCQVDEKLLILHFEPLKPLLVLGVLRLFFLFTHLALNTVDNCFASLEEELQHGVVEVGETLLPGSAAIQSIRL